MSELAPSYESERSEATVRQIGRTALWGGRTFEPDLGINDPLTHLEQFLERGQAAMQSVDEDLITDIAERKLKPVFINSIEFDQVGDDFISRENKFSMRKMTAITKDKFSKDNVIDIEQYERAKIEASEVQRLNAWFETAEINDNFIVESLPLGNKERYTIVRIYQKTGAGQLVEQVITLHNADVASFNQLHQDLGVAAPAGRTELEVLDNMYAYRPAGAGFETAYVAAFDALLAAKSPGQEYSFGLPKADREEAGDDMANVRRQTALRKVYLDMVSALGNSGGYASKDLIAKANSLGCSVTLIEDQAISYQTARQLLDTSLQSVVATFNRASKKDLDALAISQDSSAAADYAGHHGSAARAEGVRYDGACPSSGGAASSEAAAAATAYRFNQDPSKCGTCPNCKKQYFADPEAYEVNVLECNNCHAAITFDGKSVSREDLDELHGRKSKSIGFVEGLGLLFEKNSLEDRLNNLLIKQQSQQSEFQRRRGLQLIEEYQQRLEEIKYLTC